MGSHRLVQAVSTLAFALLLSGQVMAQQQPATGPGGHVPQPYSGMYGSMGNVYGPYYRQFQVPGMSAMPGMGTLPGTDGMSAPLGLPYTPQSGMYGSMGNVYHPYYRQYRMPGTGGMPGMAPYPGMR